MYRIRIVLLAAATLVSAVLPSAAQASSILERLKAGKPLTIAHRDSSIPFSYIDKANGKPVGYAMDLCHGFAEVLRKRAGLRTLEIRYLPVTSGNRIEAIEQGRADLECGSTSNTAERRARVAFVIPHFITGARLMVRASSRAETLEDVAERRVVSTQGSTPLKALHLANAQRRLNLGVIEAADHGKAVEMVELGKAEAFVMDDVLLYGLAATRPNPAALKVTGKFLTTEAIAVMLARDDTEAKKLLDEEMRRLIFSGEIFQHYDRWFMKPIPSVAAPLNMPTSFLLRAFWKFPTDYVPG